MSTIVLIFSIVYMLSCVKTNVPISDSVLNYVPFSQQVSIIPIDTLFSSSMNSMNSMTPPFPFSSMNSMNPPFPFSSMNSMNPPFSSMNSMNPTIYTLCPPSMNPLNTPIISIISDNAKNTIKISHQIVNPDFVKHTSADVILVTVDPSTSSARVLTIGDANNINALKNFRTPFLPAHLSDSQIKTFELKNPLLIHQAKLGAFYQQFLSADKARVALYKATELEYEYHSTHNLNSPLYYKCYREYLQNKLINMRAEDQRHQELVEIVEKNYIRK